MIIILIGIALAIGLYFYTQKYKTTETMKSHLEPFIPSKTFMGAKSGYVFKNDHNGIGYYLDKIKA